MGCEHKTGPECENCGQRQRVHSMYDFRCPDGVSYYRGPPKQPTNAGQAICNLPSEEKMQKEDAINEMLAWEKEIKYSSVLDVCCADCGASLPMDGDTVEYDKDDHVIMLCVEKCPVCNLRTGAKALMLPNIIVDDAIPKGMAMMSNGKEAVWMRLDTDEKAKCPDCDGGGIRNDKIHTLEAGELFSDTPIKELMKCPKCNGTGKQRDNK